MTSGSMAVYGIIHSYVILLYQNCEIIWFCKNLSLACTNRLWRTRNATSTGPKTNNLYCLRSKAAFELSKDETLTNCMELKQKFRHQIMDDLKVFMLFFHKMFDNFFPKILLMWVNFWETRKSHPKYIQIFLGLFLKISTNVLLDKSSRKNFFDLDIDF